MPVTEYLVLSKTDIFYALWREIRCSVFCKRNLKVSIQCISMECEVIALKKKRRRRVKLIIVIAVVFLILGSITYVLEERLSEVVAEISIQTIKASSAQIISEVIYEEIEKSGTTYDSLVFLEKDSDGNVTAMKTNIIEVNRLKSALSLQILKRLEKEDTAYVKIPIGTIFASHLFSGRGPSIKVRILPIGTVACDIENLISAAGINQTRHRIELCVNVQVAIITAVENTNAQVATNVCIAETVIVGEVPESYTEIDAHTAGTDDEFILDPDDIFNFVTD